jgi:general secretion pathway protein D
MSRQRIKGIVDSLDRPQARNANLKVIYLSYAKAADVAKVLSGMLQSQNQGKTGEGAAGQANVQADESTNSVLITADSDTMQSLKAVVDSLDIRRAQVLVEAIIVEVQNSDGSELGVQWMYRDPDNGFGASTDGKKGLDIGAAALDTSDAGLRALAGGLSGIAGQTFGIGRLGKSGDFLGLLRILQTKSGTNVLSTPNLLTTDNTKASISVGQKIPFKTGSYSGTTGTTGTGSSGFQSPFNTINRESVGVKLEVTPHINEGDSLMLDVKQEVSGVSDKNNPDGPITDERKIDTQILIADGQTVVLGGLIKDDVQVGSTRVPLLGSIPLVGRLFRNETSTKLKTNLLVFIRATVIRDDKVMEGATAEKYQTIRDLQIKSRRQEGFKSIPVLPEWKDTQLKESPTTVEPTNEPTTEVQPAVEAQPATTSPNPAVGE